MSEPRDPRAVLRHAALTGDWRLYALLERALGTSTASAGLAAYRRLVTRLGLDAESR